MQNFFSKEILNFSIKCLSNKCILFEKYQNWTKKKTKIKQFSFRVLFHGTAHYLCKCSYCSLPRTEDAEGSFLFTSLSLNTDTCLRFTHIVPGWYRKNRSSREREVSRDRWRREKHLSMQQQKRQSIQRAVISWLCFVSAVCAIYSVRMTNGQLYSSMWVALVSGARPTCVGELLGCITCTYLCLMLMWGPRILSS